MIVMVVMKTMLRLLISKLMVLKKGNDGDGKSGEGGDDKANDGGEKTGGGVEGKNVSPDAAVEGEKDTELDQEKLELIQDLQESNYTNEEITTHIGFTIDQE
ncbi:hypothetical protein L1887_28621 [Cichorium endivia]|nr:hypothetical protein L1887_28621 [Cichorium endivia]